MTNAGTLPSRRVLPHCVRSRRLLYEIRYYGPLGIPLHRLGFRLRLIPLPLPRQRLCRRASRVPRFSLHTCCSLYPAGVDCELRYSRCQCCLRRDMSGSASGLFICRGCRLHLMLRPVCLLPAVQLAPLRGPLTPRSGTEVSLSYLGPATRRTDAYRDGTCTRWKNAANSGHTFPRGRKNIRRVTTHHGADCSTLGQYRESQFARQRPCNIPAIRARSSREALRNSRGETPAARWKVRTKFERSPKPTA